MNEVVVFGTFGGHKVEAWGFNKNYLDILGLLDAIGLGSDQFGNSLTVRRWTMNRRQ